MSKTTGAQVCGGINIVIDCYPADRSSRTSRPFRTWPLPRSCRKCPRTRNCSWPTAASPTNSPCPDRTRSRGTWANTANSWAATSSPWAGNPWRCRSEDCRTVVRCCAARCTAAASSYKPARGCLGKTIIVNRVWRSQVRSTEYVSRGNSLAMSSSRFTPVLISSRDRDSDKRTT